MTPITVEDALLLIALLAVRSIHQEKIAIDAKLAHQDMDLTQTTQLVLLELFHYLVAAHRESQMMDHDARNAHSDLSVTAITVEDVFLIIALLAIRSIWID